MLVTREVLLDSSFIISCVRKKIDFVSQLEEQGFKVVVPGEVIEEIKDLKERKGTSRLDKEAIEIALELIERRDLAKVSLGSGKVDYGLIKKGKEGFFIATLDAEIKRNVPRRVVIFSSKKSVGVEES